MSDHDLADRYETAIGRLQRYIQPTAEGTLRLNITNDDLRRLEIDPKVFDNLKRSLEETNKKIKRGEISIEQVSESMRQR
jgi:hypothetical protein